MGNLKKSILLFATTFIMTLSLISCGTNENNSGNKIKVDNIYKGSGKFDRDTLYISALNIDSPTNDSLFKYDLLNIGIKSLSKRGFNPYFVDSKEDYYIIDAIWEPLMRKNYDGEFYPNILKQLPTVSEDKTVYLFSLKENLTWEDGTKITTKDIEFTYKFLMDSSYNGSFNRELLNIKGWEKYRNGESDSIEGFEIIDDYTFRITVENPTIYTMELLNIYPLSFTYYGQYYFQGRANELNNSDIKPFGNGVFKYLGYEEDKYLTLESNSFYFKGKSNINTLTFKAIGENNFINELTTGKVDFVRDEILNDEVLYEVSQANFLSGYIFSNYGYASIGINHKNPILQDVNIRSAINMAIDKNKIIEVLSNGSLDIIDAPIDKNFYNLFYDKGNVTNEFNKNSAISTLEKLGWKKNENGIREKDGQKLEFVFLIDKNSEVVSKIFPLIKSDLENVGINIVEQEIDEDFFYLNDKNNLVYDMFLMDPNFNYDPYWYNTFHTNGKDNYYFYSNPELDNVLNNISTQFDLEQSGALYQNAYEILKKDLPVIPIFQSKQFDIYNARIMGINSVNIFKTFYYDEIILKK